jgi:hypothetical protein
MGGDGPVLDHGAAEVFAGGLAAAAADAALGVQGDGVRPFPNGVKGAHGEGVTVLADVNTDGVDHPLLLPLSPTARPPV